MPDKSRILSNARIVVRELMSEPDAIPLISACAVAGNGWQENLMEPVTTGTKDHGSDGLLQWRLDRLEALQRLPGWNTLPVQCRFFKMECKRDYPTLWAQLTNPGKRSLENLTLNVCDLYERPSRAGRKADARIGYSRQVLALHDSDAPAPIEIPPSLQPAVNGVGSSLAGIAALLYAAIQYSQHGQWGPWVAIGLIAVFWIGDKNKYGTSVADAPPPSETTEKKLDPTMIPKVLQLLEALVPFLEKVVTQLPQIEHDVEAMKAALAPNPDTAANGDRIAQLIDRLNKLGAQ